MGIFTSIKEKITGYLDVHIKLMRLSFIERTSGLLSYLMFGMIVLFIFFCIILFLGFGLTELFTSLGLSRMASIFVTIGVYILLLTLVLGLRKNITRFFSNGLITVLTDGDDDEDKNDEKEKE